MRDWPVFFDKWKFLTSPKLVLEQTEQSKQCISLLNIFFVWLYLIKLGYITKILTSPQIFH